MTLLNTPETYQSLQPFKTLEELNDNTTRIREKFGKQLTRSAYRVLDVLHRYSCKYYGVSYLSKSKIAKLLGITRRTVINACNLLEALGIVGQKPLNRHNGDRRQSSNAIVFVPIKPVNDENFTPEFHTIDTPLNSKPKQSFHDAYASLPSLYTRFKLHLENTIGDTTIASLLFGIHKAKSLKHMRFAHHEHQGGLFDDLAMQALRVTTQATKHKPIDSITGYYNGVLGNLIDKVIHNKHERFEAFDELCTH